MWYTAINDDFSKKDGARSMEPKMTQEELIRETPILSVLEEVEHRNLCVKYIEQFEENVSLKNENEILRQQLAFYKKMVHGPKTEKTEVVMEKTEQLSLFDEAETEATSAHPEKEIVVEKHARKAKRTHEEAFEHLPVEEVIHEAENKICEKCGEEMLVIGKEKVRDELVYVPAKIFVRRHFAEVVKCSSCGSDETRDAQLSDIEACTIRQALVPAPVIPHSYCSPELLAHIVYEKYCNAVPLERQAKDLAAKGVKIPTATLANWVIYAANVFLKPIYAKMKSELLGSIVIHADETVVQVLREPGRKAKTDSRMWVYCSGKYEKYRSILFEYQQTRNGDHAKRFLGDFSRYLVCDGFDGYNKLLTAKRCGCYTHLRRKFVEALPTDENLLETSVAAQGVKKCNEIFDLERQWEDISPEERLQKRQELLKPVLDGFFAWIESMEAVGGTKLAKALQYAKNEKKYLYTFLEHPDVPIDNNRAENAIRPFCIGRKNWLFSTSPKGAEASAIIYSVAATACANGLNVEEYLTNIFKSHGNELTLPR